MKISSVAHDGARLFLLNNQLTDFSFSPTADGLPIANRVQAGKRPRSSMAPALVFDRASGQLVGTVGSPGGSQIIGYVTKTLVGVLDWNLDIQQAISLPNFGSRRPGRARAQDGISVRLMAETLKARGHDVPAEIDMASGLQGIVRGSAAERFARLGRRRRSASGRYRAGRLDFPFFSTSGQERQWRSKSATRLPPRSVLQEFVETETELLDRPEYVQGRIS